jgi:hypothetical protein
MKNKMYVVIRFATAKAIILASAFLLYHILHNITWPKEVSSSLAALLMILLWAYLSSLILFAFIQSPKKDTRLLHLKEL